LGQSAGGLHLPEPILGVDESLGHHEIVLVFCVNVGNSPGIPQHLSRAMEGQSGDYSRVLREPLFEEEGSASLEEQGDDQDWQYGPACRNRFFHGIVLLETWSGFLTHSGEG
jgi:hypothetical protein